MSEEWEAASLLQQQISSIPNEDRRNELIRRLAALAISEYGDGIFDWINNDSHHSWKEGGTK